MHRNEQVAQWNIILQEWLANMAIKKNNIPALFFHSLVVQLIQSISGEQYDLETVRCLFIVCIYCSNYAFQTYTAIETFLKN